ncbi:MAG TPA: thiamine phosphate synthase [Methylomirabilota bacterium]|nr:thiamine phosphate synthase [Methylomirabilota bacterium]
MAPDLRLCLVTDRRATAGRPLPAVVDACLRAGLRLVQLRERDLPGGALLGLARTLHELTRRHGATLLVNDRVDAALLAGADGVHLPAAGVSAADARQLVGPGQTVGVSVHSTGEAEAVAREGAADYVIFGPVYDTPAKRPFGPPQGVGALAETARAVRLPVVAVGGVTPERVGELRAAGAAGVAAIRALLGADDPARATEAFLRAWEAAGR